MALYKVPVKWEQCGYLIVHIKTLKDVERVIDFQVDRQPTTVFEFVDNCESSAWVCDYGGGGIKGQESPESLGYNRCPFCGLLIEVGK